VCVVVLVKVSVVMSSTEEVSPHRANTLSLSRPLRPIDPAPDTPGTQISILGNLIPQCEPNMP